jgi:hypothetical protein
MLPHRVFQAGRQMRSLEGTNLTDTVEQLYNDTQAQRNESYRNFGRQLFAGFRYGF